MTQKSYQEIWDNCLLIIKDNVTHQNFKTWFKPIKPISIEGHILTIQVPSQFFYEWLENNYITLLKKTIKRELGKDAKLEYHIVLENSSGTKPYVSKIPSTNQQKIDNMPVNMPININKTVIKLGKNLNDKKFELFQETLDYLSINNKIPSMIDLRYKDGVALKNG